MARFLGNKHKKEVHDLNNKQTECEISKIKTEHQVTFNPDTKETANSEGYDNCAHCIGNSKR